MKQEDYEKTNPVTKSSVPIFEKYDGDDKIVKMLKILDIENPSDKNTVDIILRQKDGWTNYQRQWLNVLIERNGERYSHSL